MQTEISLGQYAIPVLLMVILAIIYKFYEGPEGTSTLSAKGKCLAAILVGVALGLVALFYKGEPVTAQKIIDYALYGLMTGAAAVGLWEGYSKTFKDKG